ncbi:MAG: three-Cys-motif partner protein TcmP, partial [Dehalococcoidia bacterium]|nr:three-Cys-motif partner protein TcmP [Dehalococcoidia bacterium]
LRLVQAALKDWGSEVIFFFNYNRINMGVPNPIVDVHMEALFGEERLQLLQDELAAMSPLERETRITRALGEAINPNGDRYLIPFRFVRDGKRTSHYICFVTKHPLGYSIMKDVMAKHGILDQDEVPRFEYYPRWAGRQMHFDEHRPLLSLPAELRSRFKGQTLTVRRLIDQHQLGTPFISRNYKSVIREMERQGAAVCDPPMDLRRKNTLKDDTLVTFPA